MIDFRKFFISGFSDNAFYIHGKYNFFLVLLSLFVSVFSATTALQTAEIVHKTKNKAYRLAAITTGALALGGGIWTMHFIGMMAFELPAHVHYSIGLTILSFLPAYISSLFALFKLGKPNLKLSQRLTSGMLIGVGVGSMHYLGMSAMHTHLTLQYDPLIFVISIVVVIALAILAVSVNYRLQQTRMRRSKRLLISGFFLGMAIACMHYTGMAAARFSGSHAPSDTGLMLSTTYVSLGLSFFTVTVTVMVTALNGLIRSQELYNQVSATRSRLRAVLDTAVDGIITIDCEGLILTFSKSAERLFGWKKGEVIGKNIKMLMPEPDRSGHDGYLRNYLRTHDPKIIGTGREVMGLRKDGSLMPMRLAVGRVELRGELIFVGFVTDISDRYALEESLRETAERAEQATEAKTSFLANMSHEIRTPMNSIIGFTELLLQTNLTSTQRNHLNTVRESSRTLLRLINDILDTTKMEKSHMDLEISAFSLRAVAMQVESSLRLSAVEKNLTLTTEYLDGTPEYFMGDPFRLLQILTNLVSNAIKFTEYGRVDVLFSYESMVHIQVRDSGIGMTPQQVKNIFTSFTQADASISRRFGGTGLGTTITRQLAELMGGRVEVESEFGCGSIFHVWLPLPQTQAPSADKLNEPPIQLPSLHILIADDIPQNLELLSITLERAGHRVTKASNGLEAIEAYKVGFFDVVLMDVHMPIIDGRQATRLIREYEQTTTHARTPVIALTASVMAEDRQAALQAGMDGFAVKPLDVPRLFMEIAQVLDLPQGETSSVTPPSSLLVKDGTLPVDASLPAINWAQGARLWGNEPKLFAAIEQFLDSAAQRYPVPSNSSEIENWDDVLFSLHGLKGVSGNLALTEVSWLAGQMENQVRAGLYEQVVLMLPRLHIALQTVRKTLDLQANLALPSSLPMQPAETDLLPAMYTLRDILARNELNDQILESVCSGLAKNGEQGQVQVLRAAADNFEFQQANGILQQLIDKYTQPLGR